MASPDLKLDQADVPRLLRDTTADPCFVRLLQELGISLIAGIRPGAIGCFGAEADALTVSCTPVTIPLGMATDGTRIAVGSRRDITIFAPSTRLAEHLPGNPGYYDVVYVPVSLYRTGECMVHDMALDGPSVLFTNTQFSCLCRADGFSSFVPLWQPPFISALLPQDRCHLNSFATDAGRVRYATAFATSDTRQGYRTGRSIVGSSSTWRRTPSWSPD